MDQIGRFLSISASKKTLVELFYDIISPYTYFQYELLKRQLPQWKSMQLKLTPVTIAHIMKFSENRPPIMVPAKAKYLNSDLKILSECYLIPFALPENFFQLAFDIGTLQTQRFLVAVQKHSPDVHDHLVSIIYKNFFSPNNSSNITDMEVLKKLSMEAGLTSDLIEKATQDITSEEVKSILKKNNERVIAMNGFGLPITLVHSEKPKWVFGSDRMHVIGYLLGEKNPPILR